MILEINKDRNTEINKKKNNNLKKALKETISLLESMKRDYVPSISVGNLDRKINRDKIIEKLTEIHDIDFKNINTNYYNFMKNETLYFTTLETQLRGKLDKYDIDINSSGNESMDVYIDYKYLLYIGILENIDTEKLDTRINIITADIIDRILDTVGISGDFYDEKIYSDSEMEIITGTISETIDDLKADTNNNLIEYIIDMVDRKPIFKTKFDTMIQKVLIEMIYEQLSIELIKLNK